MNQPAPQTFQRLAAAAPVDPVDPDDAVDDSEADAPAEREADRDLDALCVAWVAWCRSRRVYVRPSAPASLLGRLTSKGSGRPSTGGPNAPCNAELAAFHLAYLAQPIEALDRKVFELHYYWGVRNIKTAAAELGIGRRHWYTLLREFRQRVYSSGQQLLARAPRWPSPSRTRRWAGAWTSIGWPERPRSSRPSVEAEWRGGMACCRPRPRPPGSPWSPASSAASRKRRGRRPGGGCGLAGAKGWHGARVAPKSSRRRG